MSFPWTNKEEQLLVALLVAIGKGTPNVFQVISSWMPDRTTIAVTNRWRQTLKNTTTPNDRVRWGPEDHERIRASMKSWDNVGRDELLKMKAKGDSWKDITSTLQTHSEYDCRTYWMIHYWPTPNGLELNDSRISEVALSNLTHSKYLQDTTAGQAQQSQEDSRRVYGQVDAVDEEAVPRDSQRAHFTPAQFISAQVMQARPMQAQPTLAPPTQAQSMQTQPTQAQTPAKLRESPSDGILGQSLLEYLRHDRWKLGSTADTDHIFENDGINLDELTRQDDLRKRTGEDFTLAENTKRWVEADDAALQEQATQEHVGDDMDEDQESEQLRNNIRDPTPEETTPATGEDENVADLRDTEFWDAAYLTDDVYVADALRLHEVTEALNRSREKKRKRKLLSEHERF